MTVDADQPAAGTARLAELARRLDEAAATLRNGEVEPDEARRLAGECAELAAEAAVELDRAARGSGPDAAPPGQEELL